MLFKLAWRNIWRNRRRSIIVLCSILVGMVAIILDESLIHGMMNQMLENQISAHISHIQIHKKGFHDRKLVQDCIPEAQSVAAILDTSRSVAQYGRRVILFGLASSAASSSGAAIVGVEPSREGKITNIAASLVAGEYLSGRLREIVIGEKLAEKLDLSLGSKMVLMASTVNGEVGSELFRIVGIYSSFSSDFEKAYVYIPIADAQRMVDLGNDISELVVRTSARDEIESLGGSLERALGPSYEVMTYREILPVLIAQVELYEQMMFIIYIIVGTAMIFGIINAMLMSTFERIREFGVLMAMGMKATTIFRMVLFESLLLGLIGTVVGMVAGLALFAYLADVGFNLAMFSESLASWGIGSRIYPALPATAVFRQIFIVPAICILGALYPAYKIMRLQPIRAIYHT